MAEKHQGGAGALVWGIILLFLGIVFLLHAFGVVPWGIWGILWRFWPVLLIIIGLRLILRRLSAWVIGLIAVVLLGAAVGVSVWRYDAGTTDGTLELDFADSAGDIRQAEASLDLAAGDFTIGSLPAGSLNFAEGRSGGAGRHLSSKLDRQGNEARLDVGTEPAPGFGGGVGFKGTVDFNGDIPLVLRVKVAAGNAKLDLNSLMVRELSLSADASNVRMTLPAAPALLVAGVRVNAGNVEITVPSGVAARIETRAAVGTVDVDDRRFPEKGSFFVSPDYDTAVNKIELSVDVNVGRATVN